MRHVVVLCCLVLFGCSPSSMEDFQKEGKAHCQRLVSDLQKVETTDQLLEISPKLKKRFHALVVLIIEARKFQDKNPEQEIGEIPYSVADANEELIFELERVYQIERGREIVEKAQRDALHHLDAFEKKRKKKQERLLMRD